MRLILASTSRYRAGLLERLELPFETVAPGVDEAPRSGESPRDLVLRLSIDKARAGSAAALVNPESEPAGQTGTLVIGSDQVAVLDDEVLGKPGTTDRAIAQLARLSGREVVFLTGLCLFNPASNTHQTRLVETPVCFRTLTRDEITDYVEREQPLDCAGAFKSEGLGIALFERIGGPDPNALIGLPLIELCGMLMDEGVSILGN
jgi:MAF protein